MTEQNFEEVAHSLSGSLLLLLIGTESLFVSLGGRGLGTNLMLYYNSNTWGGYIDGSITKLVKISDNHHSFA